MVSLNLVPNPTNLPLEILKFAVLINELALNDGELPLDISSAFRSLLSQNIHLDLDGEDSIVGEEVVVVTPGEGNTPRPSPTSFREVGIARLENMSG